MHACRQRAVTRREISQLQAKKEIDSGASPERIFRCGRKEDAGRNRKSENKREDRVGINTD